MPRQNSSYRTGAIRPKKLASYLPLLLIVIVVAIVAKGDDDVKIPAELLAKALNHASQFMSPPPSSNGNNDEHDDVDIISQLRAGNIDALHRVAKSLNDHDDKITSTQIWHRLADGPARHIPSMIALGFAYSGEEKLTSAEYFVRAGEDGPHHSSLYNAGRTFVELEDWTRALAYFRAAVTLPGKASPPMENNKITEISRLAYQDLSDNLLEMDDLSMQQAVNLMPYANIDDGWGEREAGIWDGVIKAMTTYAETKSVDLLEAARSALLDLEIGTANLSALQMHIVRVLKQLILATLANSNEEL